MSTLGELKLLPFAVAIIKVTQVQLCLALTIDEGCDDIVQDHTTLVTGR